MELAAIIGTSAGTAGTAAATAGTAAAAGTAALTAGEAALLANAGAGLTGATAAGSSLFSLSSLSTGLTLASMASSVFGGMQEGKAASAALEAQAKEDLLAARQEELKGKQQANDIMESMLQNIAAQRLAFSGAGVDPSFGTPAALASNTRKLAEAQLGTSRDNTIMLATSRRRSANARMQERESAFMTPVMKGVGAAIGTGANLLAAREARG